MSKTTALMEQAQPFLRDRYASVRQELGPRIAHTRDVAVPIALDMSNKALDVSHRMREEYLPEAGKRAMLAAAVLKGAELERVHERHLRWRLVAAATAAGAAIGAGAVMWQRMHSNNDDMWTEERVDEANANGSTGTVAD
ncbi:hypothetical protein KDK95_00735 [Actinospica sp. MGRD01-02]|uniref:Uncharacterized protein n=1 Tax=Actinospica acidithermotolerans TaxID=2828514 RepID=A0A941E7F6_9ACTN|nr:hypothetical protein [Actinospica acidithermotolerans]MBR7824815.1 hypothetical protein [Actinospica acidithermotolerans]